MQITHVYKTDYMRLCKQGLVLACILASVGFIIEQADASTYKERLTSRCEMGYIGYEYDDTLAKPCKHLWTMWTKQILNRNK